MKKQQEHKILTLMKTCGENYTELNFPPIIYLVCVIWCPVNPAFWRSKHVLSRQVKSKTGALCSRISFQVKSMLEATCVTHHLPLARSHCALDSSPLRWVLWYTPWLSIKPVSVPYKELPLAFPPKTMVGTRKPESISGWKSAEL